MEPTEEISRKETKNWENENQKMIVTSQLWQRKGITCPKGTIPIRRIKKMKNFDIHNYGRKKTNYHEMQLNGTEHNVMLANHSVRAYFLSFFRISLDMLNLMCNSRTLKFIFILILIS